MSTLAESEACRENELLSILSDGQESTGSGLHLNISSSLFEFYAGHPCIFAFSYIAAVASWLCLVVIQFYHNFFNYKVTN